MKICVAPACAINFSDRPLITPLELMVLYVMYHYLPDAFKHEKLRDIYPRLGNFILFYSIES